MVDYQSSSQSGGTSLLAGHRWIPLIIVDFHDFCSFFFTLPHQPETLTQTHHHSNQCVQKINNIMTNPTLPTR